MAERRNGLACLLGVWLIGGLAAPLDGQTRGSVCHPGHPLPRCHVTVLTEVSITRALAGTQGQTVLDDGSVLRRPLIENAITGSLGLLRNVDPRFAIGGAARFVGLHDGAWVGAELRVRAWARGGRSSADLGGGFLVRPPHNESDRRLGVTMNGAFMWRDRIGATARIDILDLPQGSARGASLGVRTGAEAGVITALAASLLAVLIASAVGGS